jgi:two-component system sensor histidine kinase ChiS
MSGFTNPIPRSDIRMSNFDREGARARILLVDDEEDARELATLTLSEYTLICARDFDEGLRIARLRYFDLYILDSWLPDKSGVELCRAIREFDPHTPILFYSAAAYAKDIQEGLCAGAQAYLSKPINSDELRQTVSQLISGAPGTAS